MKAFTLQEILITLVCFSLLLGSFWSLIEILAKSEKARKMQVDSAEESHFWNFRLARDFSKSDQIQLEGNSIKLKNKGLSYLIYSWSNDKLVRISENKEDSLFGNIQAVCTMLSGSDRIGAVEIAISTKTNRGYSLLAFKYYSAKELMQNWDLQDQK